MEPIAIKAFYGEEVRRFSVDSVAGFAEMTHELKTRFMINEDQKVTLKFKDDEDEMCTFTDDKEMREAIKIVAAGATTAVRRYHHPFVRHSGAALPYHLGRPALAATIHR